MTQPLTDQQASDRSILACAVFLAEKINNHDGHATAVEQIVAVYLAKEDVDTAAELADSVENTFTRDRLLLEVAEKCAEKGDDEYALQLAYAIEDKTFQEEARERIAIHKAERSNTDEAAELAETVSDNSSVLGTIALKLYENGDEAKASETLGKIEDAAVKVYCLQQMAFICNEKGQKEKSVNFLETAVEEAKNIEIEEEKIRALLSIAEFYQDFGDKGNAINTLAVAQDYAESLGGTHRNSLLNQISVGFLNAGSLELADRALDLVDDKVVVAAALTHYAEDFFKRGETAEALDILEEARAILEAQHKREVRNSQEKFSVLSSIAGQFASFDKPERAIEVALENPSESDRFSALRQIARTCAAKNREDLANQAISQISEDDQKLRVLLSISDIHQENGKTIESVNLLREIDGQLANVNQVSLRIVLSNELLSRFFKAGDFETARRIARENIGNIGRIFDESLKTIALARLGAIYETFNISLNQEEKDALLSLLRQPPRF